jgi:catechol 2,3-dioxygenase-like lactoylglutathione lyase family enzyme
MGLHRLTHLTIGVPNLAANSRYYSEFGLEPCGGDRFSTADGGEQLRLVETPTRRLLEMRVGADDPDDLARIGATAAGRGAWVQPEQALRTIEPVTGVRVVVEVAPRLAQPEAVGVSYNGPGRAERVNARAQGVLRDGLVKPRKLGHVVLGTTDLAATRAFFTEVIGFKVSDEIAGVGVFLRCSTDHHNLLVLAAPVDFLHHTAWQVEDIDEVGRGASGMLEGHPERHVWGLGRHHAGSNFFWYLKDPAGNFSEYYSDLDCIVDDQLWTPEAFEGARGLFNWGPPPPPSFLKPDDLGALMSGTHAAH